ncbi:MAG: twin-arginine translocase subunit TatC [Candidatus Hydrothermarchaeales archaeon]
MKDGIQWAELLYRAKKRFIFFIAFVFVGFSVFWFLTDGIISHVKLKMLPPEARVIAISPMEYVLVKLELSLLFAILTALPIFAVMLLRRLNINMHWKSIIIWGLLAVALFGLGFFFTYFLLLPITIEILTSLTSEADVLPYYSINQFIIFTVLSTLIFSFVFELPLAISWLAINGYVSVDSLKSWRKQVYVVIFVVTGIITPDPTPMSQILLGVPLLFLYEASIVSAKIFGKKT